MPSSFICWLCFSGVSCLVKRSAVFSGSQQSFSWIAFSLTCSLIQCHQISICFECLWNCGFIAIARAPLLSPNKGTGLFVWNPDFTYRFLNHFASHTASDKATYSASVNDKAIVVCFFDPHVSQFPSYLPTSFYIGWYTTYFLPSFSLSSISTYQLHTMCFPCASHLFFFFIQCMDYAHCPCFYLMFFTFSVYKWVVYCHVTVEYSWEPTSSSQKLFAQTQPDLISTWAHLSTTQLLTIRNYYLIPWSHNKRVFSTNEHLILILHASNPKQTNKQMNTEEIPSA